MSLSANFPTTRPSLLLDFVNSGQMDPRITFSRASGATWFNSAGTLIGVDASSSSLTVGTGQQTLTLAATAGVDRGWIVGTSVLLSASTVTNTMTGVVVSYTASTQVLVVNVASVVGSGTYATWQVSNLMPRFDYNPSTLAAQGLLIEESRTNSLTYSEDLTNAAWVGGNVTVSANATTSPAGTTTADTLIATTTNAEHTLDQSFSVTSGTTYTFTAFVKAAGLTDIGLRFTIGALWTGSASPQVRFDLTAGTASTVTGTPASSSITNVGNGYYRVQMSVAAIGTGTASARLQLMSGTNNVFAGDGTSGIFVWGAQLEAGAFPTSYIPTTTTALTRAADVASVNTLSPWFNATEGTWFADATINFAVTGFPVIVDGRVSSTDIVQVGYVTENLSVGYVKAGNVDQAVLYNTGLTGVRNRRIAFGVKTNDFAISTNGGPIVSDALGSMPTNITSISLGNAAGANVLNGYLRRIAYYPRRLSNAELQSITV